MAVKSSLLFIGKYYYKAKDRSLHYDVRSCGDTDGNAMSWKMQLINSNDLDCNINLKTNECLSYDETFCGVQNGNILDVTKFVEILGNPDSIKVAVNFMIVKLNCNGATLDLKAIENLKCEVCRNYLVPPLFYLDGKAICDFCLRTNSLCMPCDDPNLLKLVSNAIYPCRWRGCNFVCKSNIFNDHLINCEFRLSCCIYSKCKTSFRFVAAGEHLKTHEDKTIVYMPNEITYKTSFAEDYTRKDILTSRNKKLIMFRHKMESHNSKHIHEIKLYRSSDHHYLITGVVHFEHMHCTLTKKFEISGAASFQVALDKLPPCFKQTDELTVSVDLFV